MNRAALQFLCDESALLRFCSLGLFRTAIGTEMIDPIQLTPAFLTCHGGIRRRSAVERLPNFSHLDCGVGESPDHADSQLLTVLQADGETGGAARFDRVCI